MKEIAEFYNNGELNIRGGRVENIYFFQHQGLNIFTEILGFVSDV
jgi:hypothetical protein